MKESAKNALAAFSLLGEAIGTVIDDVKKAAKNAIDNDSESVEKLVSRQRELTDITNKVRSLKEEFRGVMAGNPPIKTPPRPRPTRPGKGNRTKISVRFADGVVLDEPTAAETFAASLQKIGLGRVLPLNEMLNGAPLVSARKTTHVDQRQKGGYWITTHSSTVAKKKMLDNVAKRLGERITVKVVAK